MLSRHLPIIVITTLLISYSSIYHYLLSPFLRLLYLFVVIVLFIVVAIIFSIVFSIATFSIKMYKRNSNKSCYFHNDLTRLKSLYMVEYIRSIFTLT